MKPSVLFFDFVETIADVSRVPKESLCEYAQEAHEISEGRQPFRPIEFGHEWGSAVIPSSVRGSLVQIRRAVKIAVLTNAPLQFAVDVSAKSGVNWDAILTGEMFGQYKANPRVYEGALQLMQLLPAEAMMVAAHAFDVEAARKRGMHGWLIGNKSDGADGPWEALIESLN